MYGISASDDASLQDINLENASSQPGDTISALVWSPQTSFRLLGCASWDSKIRIYDTVLSLQNSLVLKTTMSLDDPILSLYWTNDMLKMLAGCINGSIKYIDIQSNQFVNIGIHEAGVKDVYWLENNNLAISLSFDKTMKIWDLKSPTPVTTFNLGAKVYCSDFFPPFMIVGLSDEKLLLIDFNNLAALQKTPLDYIDSPLGLGSQYTSISFFSDASGLGIGSFDGRSNLSSITKEMTGKVKLTNIMTFKCHKTDNPQTLYPVHGIGFHPKSKNFVYTAGGEGNIYFWDYGSKTKIKSFNFKGQPVCKVKLSPDGLLMGYGLGYDWAKGIEGVGSSKPKLCVHIMQENEFKAAK